MAAPVLTVGRVTVTPVLDASFNADPAILFPTVPREAWDAYRDFADADGRLLLSITSYVVRTPSRTVMVDTGIGGRKRRGFPVGALMTGLQALGVRPEDVDLVVHTHLHIDHTGWNTLDVDGAPAPAFPGARHLVQRADWEYFSRADVETQNPHITDTVVPVHRWGRLDLLDGEQAITPEITAVPTPGHTPGHMSLLIADGGERAFIIGDVAHHPAQLSETDWSPVFDVDPERSRASRRALAERMASDAAYVVGGHFASPGFGRLVTRNGRRRWEPLPLE